MKKYHELSRAYFTHIRCERICRVKFYERHAPHKGKDKTKGRDGTRFLYGKGDITCSSTMLLSTMTLVMNIPKHIANITVNFTPFSNGFKALNKFNSSLNAHTSRATQIVYI